MENRKVIRHNGSLSLNTIGVRLIYAPRFEVVGPVTQQRALAFSLTYGMTSDLSVK